MLTDALPWSSVICISTSLRFPATQLWLTRWSLLLVTQSCTTYLQVARALPLPLPANWPE
jgi:hypothetical protein